MKIQTPYLLEFQSFEKEKVYLSFRDVMELGLLVFPLHAETLFVSLPLCIMQLYRIGALKI